MAKKGKQIRSKESPLYCLDVPGGSCCDNSPIITYKCHKGPNQRFKYNRRTKRIQSTYNDKCITVKQNQIMQPNQTSEMDL